MSTNGVRSRFALVIGSPSPTNARLRQADIYAASRWITCDDSMAFLPHFTDCLMSEVSRLLAEDVEERLRRPYPNCSVAENHQWLREEPVERYWFMNWGPTTDNVSAHLFLDGGIASIAFSFWRPQHHDPAELGQVFIAEIPLRELTRVLHQAALELAHGFAA